MSMNNFLKTNYTSNSRYRIFILQLLLIANSFYSSIASAWIELPLPNFWMPIGGSVSYSSQKDSDESNKFGYGGEASLTFITDGFINFTGIYTDINKVGDTYRITAGPEIAFRNEHRDFNIIFDGGYLEDISENNRGCTFRLLFQTEFTSEYAAVMPYVRYGYYFNNDYFFESGILLKFPIPLL